MLFLALAGDSLGSLMRACVEDRVRQKCLFFAEFQHVLARGALGAELRRHVLLLDLAKFSERDAKKSLL